MLNDVLGTKYDIINYKFFYELQFIDSSSDVYSYMLENESRIGWQTKFKTNNTELFLKNEKKWISNNYLFCVSNAEKPFLNGFNSLVTKNNKFNWLYYELDRGNFHQI